MREEGVRLYIVNSKDSDRKKATCQEGKWPAIHTLSSVGRVSYLVNPTIVAEDKSDKSTEFILGNGSNDPSQRNPVYTSFDAFKSIVCLVKADFLREGSPYLETAGEPFNGTTYPLFAEFMDNKEDQHLLVLVCKSFPVSHGQSPIKGKVDDGTLSAIETAIDVNAGQWLEMLTHPHAERVNEAFLNDKSGKKKYHPKRNRGQYGDSSPYTKISKLDDEMEDTLRTEIENLNIELEETLNILESARDLKSPIPRRIKCAVDDDGTLDNGTLNGTIKGVTTPTSTNDLQSAHIQLYLFRKVGNKILPPLLQEEATHIMSITNKSDKNALYLNHVLQMEMELCSGDGSDFFLSMLANLPQFTLLQGVRTHYVILLLYIS